MNQITTETEEDEGKFEAEMAYPTIKQGWGILGLFLAITFAYFIPLTMISLFGIDIQHGPFFVLNYAVPVIILIFITGRWWKKNPRNTEVFKLRSFPSALLPVVVVMTLAIVIIDSEIGSWLPMPDILMEMFKEMLQPNIWGFLTVVVAAPILEELLMRGIVLDGLLRNYSPWKAIIWSSVFFGVIHLNPWQFITAMIAGIAIGYLYWKTKSLFLCMLIHALNNGIAFYLMVRYSDSFDLAELFDIGILERIGLFVVASLILWGSYRYFEDFFSKSKLVE
ncbi:type II CAAX endopeptidase family protein [Labilibaculum sp. K2S]|uniref:CPBP family intramembrane glutamic endopeptidase n=1 Tax=Labilibaculum sp. K2S TaxID=3056386 RepID=UPI0025A48BDB|nr:type II CAAX endopeptidase family protein [Labilibaculum sp. K2S]MDM8158966.1 type II CAAX endopeptidase family protein [Labilibaculum sp. K2S]